MLERLGREKQRGATKTRRARQWAQRGYACSRIELHDFDAKRVGHRGTRGGFFGVDARGLKAAVDDSFDPDLKQSSEAGGARWPGDIRRATAQITARKSHG